MNELFMVLSGGLIVSMFFLVGLFVGAGKSSSRVIDMEPLREALKNAEMKNQRLREKMRELTQRMEAGD